MSFGWRRSPTPHVISEGSTLLMKQLVFELGDTLTCVWASDLGILYRVLSVRRRVSAFGVAGECSILMERGSDVVVSGGETRYGVVCGERCHGEFSSPVAWVTSIGVGFVVVAVGISAGHSISA